MPKQARPDYCAYPEADDIRTGIKVGWRIYCDRKAAETCATAARHNAVIQESLGYDFGYCMPGSIETLADGRFKVCIP
ncbi:MAG: hypothetical protein J2P55_00100 [Rhizobiales bacterium]|nr:hypothetical protein [Hyphomicrobiales bacterium]